MQISIASSLQHTQENGGQSRGNKLPVLGVSIDGATLLLREARELGDAKTLVFRTPELAEKVLAAIRDEAA